MSSGGVKVAGCYKLPVSVGVTSAVLGRRFRFKADGRPMALHIPRITWIGDRPILAAPLVSGFSKAQIDDLRDTAHHDDFRGWGTPSRWNPEARTVTAAHVEAVVVTFAANRAEIAYGGSLVGVGQPVGDDVRRWFRELEAWFRLLATWIEVAVDQDLNADAPLNNFRLEAIGFALMAIDGGTVSSPGTSDFGAVTLRRTQMLGLGPFRTAIRRANTGVEPSLAHVLLRDARTAARRGRRRIAAIDVGSALETALADFNANHVGVTFPPKKNPTLGTYCGNAAIIAAARLPTTIQADVVEVRNVAIHHNVTPTPGDLNRAIAMVSKVINRVDPLPFA